MDSPRSEQNADWVWLLDLKAFIIERHCSGDRRLDIPKRSRHERVF